MFFHVFSRPSPGPQFSHFFCDLVPKRLILGAPWRSAGPQMAPKITQVVPKSHPSGAKKDPESIIPRIVLHHWTRTMINEKNDKKTPAQKHSLYALLLGSAKI